MNKVVVFAFGRMNPATTGHLRLVREIVEVARKNKADARLYLSRTPNTPELGEKSRNPLSFREKFELAKKSFPMIRLVDDAECKNAVLTAAKLAKEGYSQIIYVYGVSATDKDQEKLAKAIEGDMKKIGVGFVHHPLTRSNSSLEAGMSATKLRKAAASGNYKEFTKGLVYKQDAEKLYEKIHRRIVLGKL